MVEHRISGMVRDFISEPKIMTAKTEYHCTCRGSGSMTPWGRIY